MKSLRTLFYILTVTLLLNWPVAAQSRGSGASERERGRGGNAGSTGGFGSVAGRGVSVGATATGVPVSGSRQSTGSVSTSSASGSRINGGAVSGPAFGVPKLEGTSFNSLNSYFLYQDFLWSLRTRYMLDAMYFRRFYINSEPLVTPQLLKMAIREPLGLSSDMIAAVDELEAMVADLQSGKQVRKQDIAAKTRYIREMAKKIRKDQSLAFIDQRLDKEIGKREDGENLGQEAIPRLRALVMDLNAQLKTMHTQTSTASVSVHSLSQPSFGALSKGIEKLTKVIEKSL